MKIEDGIQLLDHPALHSPTPTAWADLGCGSGFFTQILSAFIAKGSTVYAVDAGATALKKVTVPKGIKLNIFALDFVRQQLPFGKLDGIMMANALHYVQHKGAFIQKLKQHILPGGLLLVVEYDTARANPWVPYPVSFAALEELCSANGLLLPEKIHAMPSAFGRANMYAALVKV